MQRARPGQTSRRASGPAWMSRQKRRRLKAKATHRIERRGAEQRHHGLVRHQPVEIAGVGREQRRRIGERHEARDEHRHARRAQKRDHQPVARERAGQEARPGIGRVAVVAQPGERRRHVDVELVRRGVLAVRQTGAAAGGRDWRDRRDRRPRRCGASPWPGTRRTAPRNSGRRCRWSSAARLRAAARWPHRRRARVYGHAEFSARPRESGDPEQQISSAVFIAPGFPLARE